MNRRVLQMFAVLGFGLMLTVPGAALAAEEATGPGDAAMPEAAEAGNEEDGEDEEQTLEERLAELISQSRSEDEYRESRRCLSRHEYRDVEIIGTDFLLFRKGDRYWLNELKRTCMALRQKGIVLSFNPRGTSQTCENQQVYVVSRFDLDRGFTQTGMPRYHQGVCWLGTFEEIQPEQAVLLREAVR